MGARKEWCLHLLHGPWQAGLSHLGFHLSSETEGSPVWTLKGKDHLIIQTSDLPSERENAWYLYVQNFLEGGQCLRAGQIWDNQQHKGICAPFAWQQENSLCYFSTTPWLETQPRTTKNISRKLGDEKPAFYQPLLSHITDTDSNLDVVLPGLCL